MTSTVGNSQSDLKRLSGKPSRPPFSLKWKTMLSVTVVLILVHLGLVYLGNAQLSSQFQRQQQESFERQVSVLSNLLRASATRLQNLGETLASMSAVRVQVGAFDSEQTKARFERHWSSVNLQMAIEAVMFFDGKSNLISDWDIAPTPRLRERIVTGVRRALVAEAPQVEMLCAQTCRQFVFVPLLSDDGRPFVTVVAASLADVIIEFSRITQSKIALLVPRVGHSGLLNHGCCWNYRPVAMSEPQVSGPIFEAATDQITEAGFADDGQTVKVGGASYQVRLAPSDLFGEKNRVLFATNVSEALRTISSDSTRAAGLAFLALLITVLILMSILWRPMSQLRQLAVGLPLLARRRYDEMRGLIGQGSPAALRDEIDVLNDVSVALSYKLEDMEQEIREHTDELAERMRELGEQRDFSQKLLDTAQVAIVTQDSEGNIKAANDHAEDLMGYSEKELTERKLGELLIWPEEDQSDQLRHISSGARLRMHHEAGVRCADGRCKELIWLHSHLDSEHASILSVGLDVTERRQAEARLRWLADHDSLTGLSSRHYFATSVEAALGQSRDGDDGGAVISLSLDRFKDVNDRVGHDMGDSVLRDMARLLGEGVSETDVVARIGGDEFSMLLPGATQEQAIRRAEMVSRRVKETVLMASDAKHSLSISAGVAVYPRHGATVKEIIASADFALNVVKQAGGGAVRAFGGEGQSRDLIEKRVFWRNKILQALEDDRFVLHFQPIVAIPTGKASHYECLIRMLDDDGSLIYPGDFIEIAEAQGLIRDVERWVVSAAIEQLAKLHSDGIDVGLSVNLSGQSFDDLELAPLVQSEIARFGVNPKQLIFEITETAAVANFTIAKNLIDQIRALGCSFAFDDFGVGFTSFQYLKQLPVDYIKIDQAFVRDVHTSKQDQVLVRSMIELSHGLGKKVIAEGIEEQACLDWLHAEGVDYAQGYLLSKPKPEIPY